MISKQTSFDLLLYGRSKLQLVDEITGHAGVQESKLAAPMPVPRESVRFSRREVRGWAGASDTQARAYLERLVNLEYLLTHRGQSFEYELIYDGDGSDSTHLAGLLDVTTIQSSRGQTGKFAGSSRPQSGVNAAGSRGTINRGEADEIRLSGDRSISDVKTHCFGKRELHVVVDSSYTA